MSFSKFTFKICRRSSQGSLTLDVIAMVALPKKIAEAVHNTLCHVMLSHVPAFRKNPSMRNSTL